jgi:hypothetical protein
MKADRMWGMMEDEAANEGEILEELPVHIEVDGVKSVVMDVALCEDEDGKFYVLLTNNDEFAGEE